MAKFWIPKLATTTVSKEGWLVALTYCITLKSNRISIYNSTVTI